MRMIKEDFAGSSERIAVRELLRQERGQADCFVAKFGPDQVLAAGGFVPFVEEQVKRLQYAV
jgi:hypothetical protein